MRPMRGCAVAVKRACGSQRKSTRTDRSYPVCAVAERSKRTDLSCIARRNSRATPTTDQQGIRPQRRVKQAECGLQRNARSCHQRAGGGTREADMVRSTATRRFTQLIGDREYIEWAANVEHLCGRKANKKNAVLAL